MLHVHGSTSATRLNSGISMIMASMYKIPQEQCPFSEIPSQQSLALLQRIAQRIIPLSQCPST